MSEFAHESKGPATDRFNSPVVDPTQNVLDLVAAAIKRQDDLRAAESMHVRELALLRAEYQEELRAAETARIDAIRAVDVAAVQQAATAAETRATALAAQVAASAEAMRSQVAAAASAAATSLAAALEPVQKDIADLRRAQYEAQGQKTQTVENRSSNQLVVGAVAAIGGLLVVGLMATTLYFSMRQHPSSPSTGVVCTAAYHPTPCP